jgi:hypothetical protein
MHETAAGNKKSLCPPSTGTKALRFCDTTQFDRPFPIRPSALFTHQHVYPVDNGWEPVGTYLQST